MALLVRLLLMASVISAVTALTWWGTELLSGDDFPVGYNTYFVSTTCTFGCYAFASLPANHSGCADKITLGTHTLTQVAALVDPTTGEKGYIELPEQFDPIWYEDDMQACPFALLLLPKVLSYQVVDPPTLIDPRVKGSGSGMSDRLWFFSYDWFTVDHLDIRENTAVQVYDYAVGIDDDDLSNPVYSTLKWKSPAILWQNRSPLLTILMDSVQPYSYSTRMGIEDPVIIDGDMDIVVTSPGHTGTHERTLNENQNPINVHIVAPFEMTVDFGADLNVDKEYTVIMYPEAGSRISVWGDTRITDPLSAVFHVGKQLNISWPNVDDTQSSFAFSLKISGSQPHTTATPITSCGQTPVKPNLSQERIVGGQTALPYSWPWQIVWCSPGWFGGCSLECGGTIINNGWIMMAGNCVYDDMNPKNWQVKAGIYKEDATSESGEQISKVKAIHLHPKYESGTSKKNDISLIELETPLKYSDHVQSVCLPADDNAVIAKPNSAYITGWGSTQEQGAVSIQLRQAKVPFVDYPSCNKEYPGQIVDNIMVCAGAEGLDSCKGDIGGPMVIQGASGAWFQVGISSFGKGCGEKGEAGVYSRVTAYCDFISTTTSGEVSCQPIA